MNVDHYLNTMISVIPTFEAKLAILLQCIQNYERVTNLLRILRQ